MTSQKNPLIDQRVFHFGYGLEKQQGRNVELAGGFLRGPEML